MESLLNIKNEKLINNANNINTPFLKDFKRLAILAISAYPMYKKFYLDLTAKYDSARFYIDNADDLVLVLPICKYKFTNNETILKILLKFEFLKGYKIELLNNQKYIEFVEIDKN